MKKCKEKKHGKRQNTARMYKTLAVTNKFIM